MIALLFFSMLVRVDPIPLGSRAWDERPASMELEEPKSIDLNSLKVVRCDAKGEPLEEVAFRFLDKTWPWEFPDSSGPGTQPRLFPRGAFLYNVQGEGKRGLLVWNHRQQGNAASFYRITYRTGATRGGGRAGIRRRRISAAPTHGCFADGHALQSRRRCRLGWRRPRRPGGGHGPGACAPVPEPRRKDGA